MGAVPMPNCEGEPMIVARANQRGRLAACHASPGSGGPVLIGGGALVHQYQSKATSSGGGSISLKFTERAQALRLQARLL
jgi:hypothetical protein